jgi:hypothetical protein
MLHPGTKTINPFMLHHNHQSLNAAPQPSIACQFCTTTINLLMLHHNHQSVNAAQQPSIC